MRDPMKNYSSKKYTEKHVEREIERVVVGIARNRRDIRLAVISNVKSRFLQQRERESERNLGEDPWRVH